MCNFQKNAILTVSVIGQQKETETETDRRSKRARTTWRKSWFLSVQKTSRKQPWRRRFDKSCLVSRVHRASTWTSRRDRRSNRSMSRSANWPSTDQLDHTALTNQCDGLWKK